MNGSPWSTSKGSYAVFLGIENILWKEELEQGLNKEAKQGWIFAANGARIAERSDSSGDSKQTFG